MKKLLAFFAVVFFAANVASAQTMTFSATEGQGDNVLDWNYGKLEQGANGVREFKFQNTGDAPLVISNAKGSCGCTVPSYPKEPIMKGQSNAIKVKYDTKRVGPFTKYVTLTTNDPKNPSIRLKIFGVIEAEAPATPTKKEGMLNGGN
ncbi:MAG: DUF1573 domain-containing protein [Aureispira sp.]|nr:DUF1573 domain-containing protein [Aureispira sp.]